MSTRTPSKPEHYIIERIRQMQKEVSHISETAKSIYVLLTLKQMMK